MSTVLRAFDRTKEAVNTKFGKRYFMTALSSRVFLRIHQKAVDVALARLEAIIRSGELCQPEKEKIKRCRVMKTVEVCIRKAPLRPGTNA